MHLIPGKRRISCTFGQHVMRHTQCARIKAIRESASFENSSREVLSVVSEVLGRLKVYGAFLVECEDDIQPSPLVKTSRIVVMTMMIRESDYMKGSAEFEISGCNSQQNTTFAFRLHGRRHYPRFRWEYLIQSAINLDHL